ncbi:MAG: TatD family hydrolase [Desulfomicrobium sp.]|nr:TatD family hydrolase [Desulfomicrobium sp.]
MSKKKERPAPSSLGLAPVGVDSHAHLEGSSAEIQATLDRALAGGVRTVGHVFLGPDAYARTRPYFTTIPNLFFILGTHPHDAAQMTENDLQTMAQAFDQDAGLRAVGEIGLDFYYDHSSRPVQEQWFRRQLQLALDLNLPVVIHCREAEEQCLTILNDMGFVGRPLLWHCFGLGPDWVEKLVQRGWHLSVPGVVTFAKAHDLRQAVTMIPEDRLLLETDAPYLAPEPYRGRPNEPALLGFTALEIARLRGEDVHLLWQRSADNARHFFGLEA